jgi:hypothetical protein
MPDLAGVQQWSTVRTSYDLLGRRSSVNVPLYRPSFAWETLSAAYGTVFQYDRFDRPILVQQPDGHTTLTSYHLKSLAHFERFIIERYSRLPPAAR